MKNIFKTITANKGAIVKKILLVAGTVTGVIIGAVVLTKNKEIDVPQEEVVESEQVTENESTED